VDLWKKAFPLQARLSAENKMAAMENQINLLSEQESEELGC
jgi:hypothetical protein